MRVDLVLESPIEKTGRVVQLSGMFDVPVGEKTRVEYHFDAPHEERPWQVGLIVGPSGAGKTSVARAMFGGEIVEGYDWHKTRAIVDGFGALGIKDITGALSSVGFSSPPNWLRPFSVLSNGERFRANMARALVDPAPRVVVDEFTSVVDRQVAQVGSHAIAKAVRAKAGKQFVAVTCHYDVEDWLQPDWVLEPHLGRFTWRSLQRRPTVGLEVVRCRHDAWGLFAPHHYLTANLPTAARCFMGLVNGQPAAFGGLLYFPHPRVKDIWSLSRLVVLPDFQGLGLGAYAFTEALGQICRANGYTMTTHPSHPALVKTWAKSSLWSMTTAPAFASPATPTKRGDGRPAIGRTHAFSRRVAHFKYAGPSLNEDDTKIARALWAQTTN